MLNVLQVVNTPQITFHDQINKLKANYFVIRHKKKKVNNSLFQLLNKTELQKIFLYFYLFYKCDNIKEIFICFPESSCNYALTITNIAIKRRPNKISGQNLHYQIAIVGMNEQKFEIQNFL